MIVLKFGGTSVAGAKQMQRVLDIAVGMLHESPVLVSSAMAKTTDTLLRIGTAVQAGDEEAIRNDLAFLREIHFACLEGVAEGRVLEEGRARLETTFTELGSLVRGLSLIRELSLRSSDALVSFGERMSTLLLKIAADQRGINAELVDARSCVKTDGNFTQVQVLKDETEAAVRKNLKPKSGKLIITQGFIGSSPEGLTTTLGRGGSDYSAAIFGAALGASEVQIWTDVTGIMTTDPRLVPGAATIDQISYEEAAELAYFGAKVIHPATIQPAVEKKIPVFVKNTHEPQAAGTKIWAWKGAQGIRAIAGKRNVTVITVRSSRMLNAYGFLKAMFSVFAEHRVPVDLVTTSEVSVSVSIDSTKALPKLIAGLSEFSQVEVVKDMAVVSLVGTDLWKESGLTSRVFTALVGVPVRMISLGGSELNLSIVVPEAQLAPSIVALHNTFFPAGA